MTKPRYLESRTPSTSWIEYHQWNEWIAEAFYVETDDAAPVYLDFEGDAAQRLCSLSGHQNTESAGIAMLEAVRSTLPAFGRNLFKTHERELRAWAAVARRALRFDEGGVVGPPPVLPLLLSFVLAAEQMQADADMGHANYYGRLARVLHRDTEDLRHSYQASAEILWGALNAWLVEIDGRRGLPTAYSNGAHRYVGIAISQALVREADRAHLPDFFEFAGLAPHAEVPAEALEPLLLGWASASHTGATKQLIRLIQGEQSRARVAEIAALQLAAWQGTDARAGMKSSPTTQRPVVLRLHFTGVPLRQPRLTPVLRVRSAEPSITAALVTAGDALAKLRLERVSHGTYAPPRASVPGAQELLQSRLRFVINGVAVGRTPVPAVVFRSDEFGVEFWETHSVVRGERIHLLVRTEFADAVNEVLNEIAPPTWRRTNYSTLPSDWTLIENVEVMRTPRHTSTGPGAWLAELLSPITTHHLSLHDGFRMPGSVRQRWLRQAPPTLTASSDSANGFGVLIERIPEMLEAIDGSKASEREVVHSVHGTADEPLVVDLGDLDLEAGSYEITLTSGDKKASSRQRRQFALITATPRNTEDRVVGLDLSDPLSAIERIPRASSALKTDTSGMLVGAAHFEESTTEHVGFSTPSARTWSEAPSARAGQGPMLDGAVPACFFKPAHNWDLGKTSVDDKGRPQEWSLGTCKICGLTKLYRNDPHKIQKKGTDQARRRYQPIQAPERFDPEHSTRLALAIAALTAVGTGDGKTLYKVLAQVDSSALTVHRTIHDLASVGILSVARDAATGAVTTWSVVPATIVTTPAGSVLTSFWGEGALELIELEAKAAGADFRSSRESLPSSLMTTTLDDDALWALAEDLESDVFHAGDASAAITFALPTLSEALEAIPRVAMPHGSAFERFDVSTASWLPTVAAHTAGAYRTGTYSREYFIRNSVDVASGQRALVDAATAKHAAALMQGGAPLMYREPTDGSLRVPIGCPLPGLYGRAAALASTRIPVRRGDEMFYDDVSAQVADQLTFLLTR